MHEATFDTPEDAAAEGTLGETLEVDASGDGRWAVVVRRHRQALGFTRCRSVQGGWVVEDDGEMTPPADSVRSTWISLVDFDIEDGPNVGVKISWGGTPPERYWSVRWQVDEDE